MQLFRLTALFLLLWAGGLQAQTSIGFGEATHDSNQAIEVTSDRLELDQTSGSAVFSGNVLIIQGALRMSAAEVQVVYATVEGSQQIDQVIATGDVLIASGTDAAEGQSAVYQVSTGEMVLSGEVLVTQGLAAIAGDRLVLDVNTGSGTVEGRVRTVLQSERPSE
jgi:lipopolysaccharide export system protein LptA